MHRRGKIESSVGRHVRSVAYDGQAERSLDVAATLLAAAPQQKVRIRVGQRNRRLKLEPPDLRVKVRQTRAGRCTLFVVDASGSMAAQRRMAAAKGAVQALLTDAYQQRDEVGLIAFRGSIAELLLPPTNSADLAVARRRALPTGGRTPLAAGLRLAQATLAARRRASDRIGSALVVLVSDGRTNVAVTADGDPHADALAAADALRAAGISALVVDSEDGPIRLGLARRLCAAMQGQYVRLSDVSGARGTIDPLVAAVRSMHAHSEGGR
jgi:magnesium chelatase subunit D